MKAGRITRNIESYQTEEVTSTKKPRVNLDYEPGILLGKFATIATDRSRWDRAKIVEDHPNLFIVEYRKWVKAELGRDLKIVRESICKAHITEFRAFTN